MNRWQIVFLVFGLIAAAMLFLFPPQMISSDTVRFLPVTDGFPIDWLRLFLWFVAIIFVAGLGIAINKTEHSD